MKVTTMDKRLMDIYQLKDIIRIDYIDSTFTGYTNKKTILPGFLVMYGHGQKMCLNSNDPYFGEFVKKLREVYLDEKERVVYETVEGPKTIQIDNLSLELLLHGDLEKVSPIYSYYENQEGYDESLLFEEDELSSIFPIIEYHLRETLKEWNITLGKTYYSEGNNGVYYFKTRIKNVPRVIPVLFKKTNNNHYHLEFGNILEKAIPLKMDIDFMRDGISVHNTIDEYQYSDFYSYEIENNIPVRVRETYLKDKQIHYQNEHLESSSREIKYHPFDEDESTPKWFQTPWNGLIGVNDYEKDIDQNSKTIERQFIYCSPSFIKERYSKRFYSKKDGVVSQSILLDSMDKSVILVDHENGSLIETSFLPGGVNSHYKTHLMGKKFYHVSPLKNYLLIDKKYATSIGRENGVEEKTDVLDIKQYIKK